MRGQASHPPLTKLYKMFLQEHIVIIVRDGRLCHDS